VRRSRRRFWGSQDNFDKIAAYRTLFDCLVTLCKLIAPLAPFLAEDVFRRLTENPGGYPESVHLCDFPEAIEAYRSKRIEDEMEIARQTVELGRAARKDSKIKVRQPLSRMVVMGLSTAETAMLRNMEAIVLDEINVKKLDFDKNESAYFTLKADPEFKNIGPKFGPRANEIANRIKMLSRDEITKLRAESQLTLSDNVRVSLEDAKIIVIPMDGFAVSDNGRLKVALDLHLDDNLVAEGNARELVNRIQNLRKSAGLDVTDRIKLSISGNPESAKALEKFSDYIQHETLAEKLTADSSLPHSQEFDLNGFKTVIALERLS
jgi:isoleucyl-tRNA synthetase